MYSLKSNLQHCQDPIPETEVQTAAAWSAIFGWELCNRKPKPIITDINELQHMSSKFWFITFSYKQIKEFFAFNDSSGFQNGNLFKCEIQLGMFLNCKYSIGTDEYR